MGYLTTEQMENTVQAASSALLDYCVQFGIHHIVTGASGGLDSDVTLALAGIACEEARKVGYSLTSIGAVLPCESTKESIELGRLSIETTGSRLFYEDLTPTFDCLKRTLVPSVRAKTRGILLETHGEKALEYWEDSERVAQGNIKARLRMITLYDIARMNRGMVLSTDNLSEFLMAFWTRHGDEGDFGMIRNIFKGLELYDIAAYLKRPKEIREAEPNDGLDVAGSDEEQLGGSYLTIDEVMVELIQRGFDPDGLLEQLDDLPKIRGVDSERVKNLAARSLFGFFKRAGCVTLSRKQLRLPEIKNIPLD